MINHINTKLRVNFDGRCLKQEKATFSRKKMINIYIVYEINLCSNIQGASLAIGALKLTKNAEPDKYNYSGYCSVFNSRESFLLSNGSDFGKNVIIFGDDMSSWVRIDNKKKDIFILGKGTTDGSDDTALTSGR